MARWILVLALVGSLAFGDGSGNGPNGPVHVIVDTDDNSILIGGQFDWVGTQRMSAIAAVNMDDATVKSVGGGLFRYSDKTKADPGTVWDIEPKGDAIYVGGQFARSGGGAPLSNVARYEQTTDKWEALGTGTNGPVRSITPAPGSVYVGGDFTTAGGKPAAGLACYSIADGTWSAVPGWKPDRGAKVHTLAIRNDTLYVGGEFKIGGVDWNYAEYDCRNDKWIKDTYRFPVRVSCVDASPTSVLVVGGFTSVHGKAASGIAYFDGTKWSALANTKLFKTGKPLTCNYSSADRAYYVAGENGTAAKVTDRSYVMTGLAQGCQSKDYFAIAKTGGTLLLGSNQTVRLPDGKTADHIVAVRNGKAEALLNKGR